MTVQTIGTSTNFVYEYEEKLAGAKQRAQALSIVAEIDFKRLARVFEGGSGDIDTKFGPSNRITVRVDNNKGLGQNSGNFALHSAR
jgi:hypothetical protein